VEYEPRKYRSLHQEKDLHHFQVMVEETDLDIGIKKELYTSDLQKEVELFLAEERQVLKEYIKRYPAFLTTLQPWEPVHLINFVQAPASVQPPVSVNSSTTGKIPTLVHSFPALPSKRPLFLVPLVVKEMCEATSFAGVGPMAAVAGFFAERVGLFLSRISTDVLVENGGDIWLKSNHPRKVCIYAGTSPFSQRIGLEIKPEVTPIGICTSSGTVGHSLSFGKADAMVILAPSAVLSDAVATAACNMVKNEADLAKAVEWAVNIPGVQGALAILGDKIAVQGAVELIPLE